MFRSYSLPLKCAYFRRFFHVCVFIYICGYYLVWGKLWGKFIVQKHQAYL